MAGILHHDGSVHLPPRAFGLGRGWVFASRRTTVRKRRPSRADTTTAERAGRRGVLLVPEVGGHRPLAADRLPTRRRGREARPRGGSRDPREQPPVVRRLAVHAADAHAPGHLRGEGGVLHQPRAQGLVPAQVLLRGRPGAHRPFGRLGRRRRPVLGAPDPRGGDLFGIYPEGAVPRRPPLPGQDRRGAPRAGDQGAGDPGRGAGYRRRGAPARSSAPSSGPASASARPWTSRATRASRATATSSARSPTRSCTRSCGSPARRRRHLRRPRQGPRDQGRPGARGRQGGGQAGEGCRCEDGARRTQPTCARPPRARPPGDDDQAAPSARRRPDPVGAVLGAGVDAARPPLSRTGSIGPWSWSGWSSSSTRSR